MPAALSGPPRFAAMSSPLPRKRPGASRPTSMDRKRPQLSVDELRQLRWLLGGLLVLISVSTVVYLEVDAWLLAIVTTIAMLLALARPDLPARVPPLAHRFAFPVIVALFAGDFYS